MKKFFYLLLLFVSCINMIQAKPIDQAKAKNSAIRFLSQNLNPMELVFTYAEKLDNGNTGFYVFNMGTDQGFIIISGDDELHPVIGYSTEKAFAVPSKNSNFGSWLQKRITEVSFVQSSNYKNTDSKIKEEWNGVFNPGELKRTSGINSVVVSPLVQTAWNQSPYYNDLCPSSSVTGCVATAMAQIMRYWRYPSSGTGSSSYCDCTSNGKSNNFGTLSCNYASTTYNWTNMPLAINSTNTDIATLMYQCGVSVEMDYDPNASGAWVITSDNPISAQTSYVNYFGYDPNTIKGLSRAYYNDADWLLLLKQDLNKNMPIQYVGYDATQGGHTWVCDGYDQNSFFHMNWGWGGYGNGFFSVDYLNVGGFNPAENEEALIGIKPPTIGTDAGISSINSPNGTSCNLSVNPVIKLQNFGSATLTSCTINYKLDNGTTQIQNWTGSLPVFQSVNVTLPQLPVVAGTHSLTCFTGNPNNGTDALASNNQSLTVFEISLTGAATPVTEGFENSGTIPSAWGLNNPDNDLSWQIITTVARTGSNCIGFNNCTGNGDNVDITGRTDRFLTKAYNFTSAAAPMMSFDVAYASYNDGSSLTNDMLSVYYSLDCGTTWNIVYTKSDQLPTASSFIHTSSQYCWIPSSNADWRKDTINLSVLAGLQNVMFAFENTSAKAENLYIDNININGNGLTGIQANYLDQSFALYPNPAKESFMVEGVSTSAELSYTLYNMAGQEIKTGTIQSSNNSFKKLISVNELSGGLYLIKVSDQNHNYIKKFNVQ